jgi:hypothetical protein
MRLEPLVKKIQIHLPQKFDKRKFTNSQQSCNDKKFIRKHALAISFLDSPWTTQENLWKIVGFLWEFLTPQFSEKTVKRN